MHLYSRINVNMGLMAQGLEPYAFVSGKDAAEVGQHDARSVLLWMQKKEDELTMAYGRRTRQQIGR